jgi:hypothetical protein
MATNKYFNFFNFGREQSLVEDLMLESIKIYGHDVKYLPRTIVARDDLYSEDSLSTFDAAAEVEVYIKNVDGLGGEGDFLSKFGLQIRDEITFTMARKRFDQIKTEKLLTEVGYNYLQETATPGTPSRQFLTGSAETDGIILEEGTGDGYNITSNRPLEGDLIYFPMVAKLFEIKFVEHEQVFYQTGRLQTYDLKCELFEYSSERINTSNTEIDSIATTFTLDVLGYEFTLEDDSGVLLEEYSGGSYLQEYRIEDTDPGANNSVFANEVNMDAILDFSEKSPWGE